MADEKKAEMIITRQSTGEQVKLVLYHVNQRRSVAVIEIPDYNARLTFRVTKKWVEIVGREKIDPDKEDALLHVSRSVWNRDFKGVAAWASAILHSKRLPKVSEPAPISAGKQWWLVLWQAAYADIPQALIKASSEAEALRKARQMPELGTFTVVRDLLFAVPLGMDKAAAQVEMSRRQKEAQETQEQALHPSPLEAAKREAALQQLRDFAASCKASQLSLPLGQ